MNNYLTLLKGILAGNCTPFSKHHNTQLTMHSGRSISISLSLYDQHKLNLSRLCQSKVRELIQIALREGVVGWHGKKKLC